MKGHGNCENTKSFQSASLIYGDCVDCKKPIFTYDTLHVEGKVKTYNIENTDSVHKNYEIRLNYSLKGVQQL